jgi:hypothetical protein
MATVRKKVVIGRTLSRQGRKVIHPHALAVGELSWASNYCLTICNLIYRHLFDKEDWNIAVRTWHTLRSDQAQLALVEAAVLGNRRLPQFLHGEILWILASAKKLSEKRNDAIHTPIVFLNSRTRFKLRPSEFSTFPARYERLLKSKSLILIFRKSTGDFLALTGYALSIYLKLANNEQGSLPKRPKMRSVPS